MDNGPASGNVWGMQRAWHSRSAILAALALGLGIAPVRADTIRIKGSNTFGESLAPALIEAFRTQHTVAFELESKGTASGIAALLAGDCDIASASRGLTEDERRLARSRSVRLRAQVIGYYGVAVIVHATNPVQRLTDTQVREIFTGAVANWKTYGGADTAIAVFTRQPGAGTFLGFQELAMNRMAYALDAHACGSDRELADAVAARPDAIGYVNFNAMNRSGIKALPINRVSPTVAGVNRNDYPYARGVRLFTTQATGKDSVKRFIEFCLSPRGQAVLAREGFVGLAEPQVLPPQMLRVPDE